MQCVQFLAFLNNMLALDTGKQQSLRAVDNVLFGGGDGIETSSERRVEKIFMNMLTAHAMDKLGLCGTIVALTHLGPKQLQQICLTEKQEKADKGGQLDIVGTLEVLAHTFGSPWRIRDCDNANPSQVKHSYCDSDCVCATTCEQTNRTKCVF